MSADSGELVFVYGTLRRGGSNAFRMDAAEFIGESRVEGKLYAITWYPGLVLVQGEGWVKGELYRVGPEQLDALDGFEGVSADEVDGAEYRRVKALARVDGVTYDESFRYAFVYEWRGPVEESRRIQTGDWLDAERPRQPPIFLGLTFVFLVAPLPVVPVLLAQRWFYQLSANSTILWCLVLILVAFAAFSAAFSSRRRERFVALRWVANYCVTVWIVALLCFAIRAMLSGR